MSWRAWAMMLTLGALLIIAILAFNLITYATPYPNP